MSFANYHNDDLKGRERIMGIIKAHGNLYEFAERTDEDRAYFAEDHAHKIFVGNDGQVRAVKLLKTVAYVAVDEDEFGNAVDERWDIVRRDYAA